MNALRASALAALVLLSCTASREEVRKDEPQPTPPPAAPPATPAQPQGTPDAEFRASRPPPLPRAPKFDAPVPVERKLKNGARVLVVENHNLPLVAVEAVILVGVNGDPPGKAGLSDFVASMLDEGTKSKTTMQIAEALEDLAAELSANSAMESTRVHLNSPKEVLPQALDLMADVVMNPAFRPEDLERIRGLRLTGLEQKKGNPSALASDEVARLLWGVKHPWGQPENGTPETVKSFTRDDLVKFHDTWFRPGNAVFVVAGDIAADEAAKLLDQRFQAWKTKAAPKLQLPPVPETQRRVVLVDKPNTSQSQVWVSGHLVGASHPDAITLRVANSIVGGLFSSRLNLNLREDKGYSYAVFSSTRMYRDTGAFLAAGGVIAKNTVEALAEYDKELARFANGEVTDDELARAKEAFIRSLPSALETNDAIAGAIGNVAVLGLPLDYYRALPGKAAALTKADIARAVKAHMQPGRWPAVVVGPVSASVEQFQKLNLGPVEVRPVGP